MGGVGEGICEDSPYPDWAASAIDYWFDFHLILRGKTLPKCLK
jgi:hypothetical protein